MLASKESHLESLCSLLLVGVFPVLLNIVFVPFSVSCNPDYISCVPDCVPCSPECFAHVPVGSRGWRGCPVYLHIKQSINYLQQSHSAFIDTS